MGGVKERTSIEGFLYSTVHNFRPTAELFKGDSNTLGVDGSQIGVLKERDQVGFRGFQESTNPRRLETEV